MKTRKRTGMTLYGKIKKTMQDLRIVPKFTLFYLFLLILSISLSSLFFQMISTRILEKKVGNVSIQTLDTIRSNVDSLFSNINSYSLMILSNHFVQQTLTDQKEPDVAVSNTVRTSLTIYMEALPSISSIYLFDLNGNTYSAEKSPVGRMTAERIEQISWYNEVRALKGKYSLKLNGGGCFESNGSQNYISFVRIVNNIFTAKPIGLMIVNIPVDSIEDTYRKDINNSTDIAIFNGSQTISDFKNTELDSNNKIFQNHQSLQSSIQKIKNARYLVSTTHSSNTDWDYIGATPFDDVNNDYTQFTLITFIIIILNSVFLFLGAVLISKLITNPIKKLVAAMRHVEKGEFCKVDVVKRSDEIGILQQEYNIMVKEIQDLISRVIQQQRIKRKAELDILQSQIKPHFLYNSLDTIAYMCISNQNDKAYDLLLALSNYYRTCLSKGSEIITIAQEIDIVKNYLLIQKVRFPEMFTEEYDIDESLTQHKIMKLVLQPLVENALVHGLRPKGESGIIRICVKQSGPSIMLSVEDDGVGMEPEKLTKIMGSELKKNMSSFGLRGTIERLQIFYGSEDIYSIESTKDEGTKITLYIPMEQE